MLEAALLLVLFFLPFTDYPFAWAGVILLLTPSLYAIWTGAPFVPTSRLAAQQMFRLAAIRPGERVYDLGCGDGRLIFEAAKRGAFATGYECAIPVYIVAKIRSAFHPRASIRYGDFWRQDYGKANVIFCFLLEETMQTFRQRIWPSLPTGCRVVSHAFEMQGIPPVRRTKHAVLYRKG